MKSKIEFTKTDKSSFDGTAADKYSADEAAFFSQHDAKLPVMPSFCECVYEYNDDHHGLLVWMCPKCEAEEEQNEA